ncbi:MAG: hypothetical protein FWD47_06170 [Treponema sp.]|nr:hypothetical protein [Treponema sp.]
MERKILKMILTLLLTCIICTGIFAKDIIYVSARGNDENTGLSETMPMKTLSAALSRSVQNNISTITIIGRLDINSEGGNRSSVFLLSANNQSEILITGKQNARGAERAVLSALGTSYAVMSTDNVKIRFENIEISGGSGEYGVGLYVLEKAQITLGEGAVVRDNIKFGVLVSNEGAIFIMDGGEVRNNNDCGVFVSDGSIFYMNSGNITENSAQMAAGVFVSSDARFEMSGGSITRNRASGAVGGVLVFNGGIFIQTGGNIRNNTAGRRDIDANIHRMR